MINLLKKGLASLLITTIALALVSNPVIAEASGVSAQNEKVLNIKKQAQLKYLKEILKDEEFIVDLNEENEIEISTQEVAQIKENVKRAGSGLIYGSWFGGADSYYSASLSESLRLASVLFLAFTPFVSSTSIATKAAQSIATIIGSGIWVSKGQYVRVDRTKRYREVKYSDGSFAYWQTKIGASVSKSYSYLGSGETIISGGMW